MYIKVHVGTNCKEEKIEQKEKDFFVVHVKEPPERGLANKKVVELLRKYFGPKAGDIRIVNGHHSQSKLVSVDGVDEVKAKKD